MGKCLKSLPSCWFLKGLIFPKVSVSVAPLMKLYEKVSSIGNWRKQFQLAQGSKCNQEKTDKKPSPAQNLSQF